MATRYYLTSSAAAGFTPTNWRGTYDDVSAGVTKKLSPAKIASDPNASVTYTENVSGGPLRYGCLRFVSDPIGAQTFIGTLNIGCACNQHWSDSDIHYKVHAYVTAGDTDTVRGTLLSNYEEASGPTNVFPNADNSGRTLIAAQTLTGVVAQSGDRIVIEIGFIVHSTYGGFNNWGYIHYGAFTGSTDVTSGVGSPSDAAWAEFSMTVAAAGGGGARVFATVLG